MDGKQHTRLFNSLLLLFVPMFILLKWYIYIPLLLVSNDIVNPDNDLKWDGGGRHRFFYSHSLIYPSVIALCLWLPLSAITIYGSLIFTRIVIVLYIPSIVHLLADVHSDNPMGKYRISCFKFKMDNWWSIWSIKIKRNRLSVKGTKIWLVGNALTMITMMTLLNIYL